MSKIGVISRMMRLSSRRPDAGEHLRLLEPGQLGDAREGVRIEREAALHQVEQLLVGVVERHGGAVAAAPDLRPRYVSHAATSLA